MLFSAANRITSSSKRAITRLQKSAIQSQPKRTVTSLGPNTQPNIPRFLNHQTEPPLSSIPHYETPVRGVRITTPYSKKMKHVLTPGIIQTVQKIGK